MGLNIGKKIKWLISQIPSMVQALLILIMVAIGIGLAIILRMLNLDMGGIVIPSLIVEIFGLYYSYQFMSNFFTKDVEIDDETALPKRKVKK
ncbi:MAG: hypothetical protein ACXQS8_08675 [Candidatus Helarchaeales archaeon]